MITVSARMGASASAARAAQPDACTAPTSPEHESEPEQVIDLTDLALLALRLSARMRAAKNVPCRTRLHYQHRQHTAAGRRVA